MTLATATAIATPAQAAPMTDTRFWQIIEQSAAGNPGPEAQAKALRKLLQPLSVADLEAFQAASDRKKADSYS